MKKTGRTICVEQHPRLIAMLAIEPHGDDVIGTHGEISSVYTKQF